MRGWARLEVVGLFPPIGPHDLGGIEAAGKLAWNCIVEHTSGRSYLISYGPGQVERRDGNSFLTGSKLRAGVAAAAVSMSVRQVLAWHLGLTPLLPILRPQGGGAAVYLHGVEAWEPLSRAQRGALLRTRPLLLANTEVTLGRFLAANPWARPLRSQIVALGLGAPVQETLPAPKDPPAAIIVSRLRLGESYKGHHELISAWPSVLARIPDAQLWVVGEGDLRPDLEALAAAKGVATHVRFMGRVDDEARDRLISSARCMVMPSRGEGFGLVYAEAMRLGRPCLVSTADAGKEVVNPPEAGLAVDPADGVAVEEALIRLLTAGPEWAEWSCAARKRYEAEYTATAFTERLIAAWQLVDG